MSKTLAQRLREQRTAIRADADKILDRSGHDDVDLSADELATFNKLVAQDRDLEDQLEAARDQELAELRAGVAAARTAISERGMPSVSAANPELDRTVRQTLHQRSLAPLEIAWPERRAWTQPGLEQRSLATTSGSGLVPTSFWDRILAHMVESSAVLAAGATVISTASGEPLKIPKSTAFSSAAIVTEGGVIGASDPTLATTKDGNFDLLGFLATQSGIAIGNAWGAYAITGIGTG